MFLLLASCSPAASQGSGVLTPGYEAVLLRYQSGDQETAVAEIAAWPPNRVREEVTRLGALRERARRALDPTALTHWSQVPAKAALMLHTDCALRARLVSASPEIHESAAAEIARMLRDDGANRDFARRWYEVMAGLASGDNRWPGALEWVERGLRDFPDSPELLLVLGSMRETAAALTVPGEARELREALVDPNTLATRAGFLQARDVREHLDAARREVEATVRDAGRRRKPDAFWLYPRGRQRVEVVAVDSLPLTTFLVLDTSGSVAGEKLVQLQTAGRALLSGLRPGDEASLLTFDQEISVPVPPTGDRARLERGVADIRPGGATALYDALYAGTVLASGRGRSLLVLFTD